MSGPGYKSIRWSVNEGIGVLEIGTPPSNAMTTSFFSDMESWEGTFVHNSDLAGIIVRGAGRHFSSGADLGDLLSVIGGDLTHPVPPVAEAERILAAHYRPFLAISGLNIPVVAVIRGVCIGSAFELALHCHYRFCSEDAVLGLPEATYNLMPGLGGIRRISELAGAAAALQLSLRGNTFGAREALELGLVDHIAPKRELESLATSFLHSTGSNYHHSKRILYLKRYFSTHGLVTS